MGFKKKKEKKTHLIFVFDSKGERVIDPIPIFSEVIFIFSKYPLSSFFRTVCENFFRQTHLDFFNAYWEFIFLKASHSTSKKIYFHWCVVFFFFGKKKSDDTNLHETCRIAAIGLVTT